MANCVKPGDWKPVGITTLERDADEAIRATLNTIVIAGPGAGKTELLAQRACYLLQTGLSSAPYRILAISFKRDAAKNLKDRVLTRCGTQAARRFDSFTFDAFAKGLLDRFREAVPERFRPTPEYHIDNLSDRDTRAFLDGLVPPAGVDKNFFMSVGEKDFLRLEVFGKPLSLAMAPPSSVVAWAADKLWRQLLFGKPQSTLSFVMIERMADLMLRANPKVLAALRATYEFVFLDEFQDTTGPQYDLMKTAFQSSSSVLTAVGDNKQRIMVWAGALENAFELFEADCHAQVKRLVLNHRSAPELVKIQQHIMKALDPSSVATVATDDGTTGEGVCRVLVFESQQQEAHILAGGIAGWLKKDGLRPRDLCVLVRVRAEIYARALIDELAKLGVKARIEAELQDLLAEPLTEAILVFLRLATRKRAGKVWASAVEVICGRVGDDWKDVRVRNVEDSIAGFAVHLAEVLAAVTSVESVQEALENVIAFIGEQAFKMEHPQYRQGNLYKDTLASLAKHLWDSRMSKTHWRDAIADFEGEDSVPIMTVHKSKGLEYHTVVFLGLEDGAFWNFRNQGHDETCAFFVAFSRAKKRVLFTFSKVRQTRSSHSAEQQSSKSIGSLYDILKAAGVPTKEVKLPPPSASPARPPQ